MMRLLEVDQLSIDYKEKKAAVENVSFAIDRREVLAIVGESGSGKSTVIRAIIGLLSISAKITRGRILFSGKDLGGMSRDELRKMRGAEVSMIFQDAGDYLNPKKKIGPQFIETIQTHVEMDKDKARDLALSMLEKVDLNDPSRIMDSYGFQLSGGMKQRVAIAMAMALRPKLLLADEPTSALDVTIQADIVRQMLILKEESQTAIVIVTHNIGLAANMADYIGVMRNGHLVEYGKCQDIIRHPKTDYTKELLDSVFELED